MSEYQNVGEPIEIELPYGQFVEINRKKVKDKDTEFISMSKGEYYLTKDGKTGKRYRKNFSISASNGMKEKIIKALEEV